MKAEHSLHFCPGPNAYICIFVILLGILHSLHILHHCLARNTVATFPVQSFLYLFWLLLQNVRKNLLLLVFYKF